MSENKTNIPNVCGCWEYQSLIDLGVKLGKRGSKVATYQDFYSLLTE